MTLLGQPVRVEQEISMMELRLDADFTAKLSKYDSAGAANAIW
jgi:hypothetical protein